MEGTLYDGFTALPHRVRAEVRTNELFLSQEDGWADTVELHLLKRIETSASGVRRGAEFRVNAYTTGNQSGPSVASDSVGNFVIAWESNHDGSDYGIFAQRFGGLGPAALAVDSAGNQVLEPGETVSVRPTWRNFSGAAQVFGGTLGDITGPAGASYAVVDGIGDYGQVADGAATACTDCYAVSVSNPALRRLLPRR